MGKVLIVTAIVCVVIGCVFVGLQFLTGLDVVNKDKTAINWDAAHKTTNYYVRAVGFCIAGIIVAQIGCYLLGRG